jgi:DHA2 family methylenomycin A resistance protein-like MFS transporter
LLPVLLGTGTGVGMGLLTASVVATAVRSVPPERAGLDGWVTNTARQTAGALAVRSAVPLRTRRRTEPASPRGGT